MQVLNVHGLIPEYNFFFFFFFFWWHWCLNSGPHNLLGRCLYWWSHSTKLFWDRVSRTICLGLALNYDPPDLCLLSSWDYRREPVPGSEYDFWTMLYNLSVHTRMNQALEWFWEDCSHKMGTRNKTGQSGMRQYKFHQGNNLSMFWKDGGGELYS
jgi:hypothetical protein